MSHFQRTAALLTLLFSGQAGASAYFAGDWLIYGGMATISAQPLPSSPPSDWSAWPA